MDKSNKGSRLFSVLGAADKTYRSLPMNLKLLISQVSKAIPDFGPRKLLRKGPGTEFYEARDFDPNIDEARRINARISAKMDKPMVIEKQAEISQRIYLWRDPDQSMEYSSSPDLYTKKEVAEIMMLSFAKHLTKNEEVVGVLDKKGTYRGGKAADNIAKTLDVRIVTGEALMLRSKPPKNSTAILFSDFVSNDYDKLGKQLKRLKLQGLSGYMVMVLDPQEIDFDYKGFVKFEGLKGELSEEFGEAERARKEYRENLAEHIRNVGLLAKANGFKLILQRTDEPFHFGLMQLYGHVSKDQTLDPILKLHKDADDNKDNDLEQAAQTPNKPAQHKPK